MFINLYNWETFLLPGKQISLPQQCYPKRTNRKTLIGNLMFLQMLPRRGESLTIYLYDNVKGSPFFLGILRTSVKVRPRFELRSPSLVGILTYRLYNQLDLCFMSTFIRF